MELIITIYGGFVASLVGIYWSFAITNWQTAKERKTERDKVLLASLKLIYSELDINEKNLKDARGGLETMPFEINNLFDGFEFLKTVVDSLKSPAFYGTIVSGDMKEITLNPQLFNPIQQAYFNMEIAISAFNTSRMSFKDYSSIRPDLLTQVDTIQCAERLANLKLNWDRALNIIDKAKQILSKYLTDHGVIISVDEDIKNLLNETSKVREDYVQNILSKTLQMPTQVEMTQ